MNAAYRMGEKLALLSPGRLSALGAGLGFGAGVVHGRYKDDPTNSAEHHLGTSLAHGLAGAALGGLTGLGASKLLQKYRPDYVARAASVPFEGNIWAADPDKVLAGGSIGPADRLAPLKQKANDAYNVWKHPAVGALSGAATGYAAANRVADQFDDWRFEQYAAQKADANNPDVPNAGRLEAHLLRRHMGPYQSSLDSTTRVTPQR